MPSASRLVWNAAHEVLTKDMPLLLLALPLFFAPWRLGLAVRDWTYYVNLRKVVMPLQAHSLLRIRVLDGD